MIETKSDTVDKDEGKEKNIEPDFYKVTYASDDSKIVKSIQVKLYDLVKVLMSLGFVRLEIDKQYFTIKIENDIVEECTQEKVIDVFEDYILKLPEKNVSNKYPIAKPVLLDKLYKGMGTYFSDSLLNRCRSPKPIEFAEDTIDASLFFYKNQVVKVTADEILIHEYGELDGKKIWKDQILPRTFKKVQPSQFMKCTYAQFVSNIANNYKDKKTGKPNDPDRFKVLQCVIGYNLHKYFFGKLKATILTDSSISDTPNGRTGKTLLVRGLSHMLNVDKTGRTCVELNGKDFNFSDKHRYQELGIDTKLVHINDARKDLDFELLFNDITEGIKSQPKGKTPYLVESKIIISTNKTIKIKGGSARDRSIEFEMADYYSDHFSPADEFKEWFFRDWDKTAWSNFDNFMLYCVKQYLKYGLIEPGQINLNRRKLLDETNVEFVTYMDEILENLSDKGWYSKKELFTGFIESYTDFEKMRQRTFTNWMKLYCEYHLEWESILKEDERRTNGKDYIQFRRKQQGVKV